MDLLEFTDNGIYCRQADVYLDPWKPVRRALITHAHSDHARIGNEHYLCTDLSKPVICHRLNLSASVESVQYGEVVTINGVKFSFHPAGHIPGSAQIRVEYKGEVWCFSGDYKLQEDGISEPFELVKCHVFVTESTFGLPIYKWSPQERIISEINEWWRSNQQKGLLSVLSCYALGKAQRVIRNIDSSLGKILVHGAVDSITTLLRQQGVIIPDAFYVRKDMKKQDLEGALIICPPSAIGSPWIKRFSPYSLAIASGWMALRGTRRRKGADRGFVLSDHADWNDLNRTVAETGAERIFVTHGYAGAFAQWLREKGMNAQAVNTQYEGELAEITGTDKALEKVDKEKPDVLD